MTTNLPTLDSGRRFIRGVSKMAYTALGKLATLPDDGSFNPNAESERAAPQMPDQKMWTPQNAPGAPPATGTPAEQPTMAPVPGPGAN
jgi:hypothetical protein